jgi:hypothetical protein
MVHESKGEEGFALIAALMVFWILTALGMLVFSVTTKDLRVSSRTVGERKAFTAAQSGIHWLTLNFNPVNPGSTPNINVDVVVDSTSSGDPNTMYSISAFNDPVTNTPTWIPKSGPPAVVIAGYSVGGGETWGQKRFVAQVTGKNTAYNSSLPFTAGLGYGPVPMTTVYH